MNLPNVLLGSVGLKGIWWTARRACLFERDWAPRTERLIRRADAVLNDHQRNLGQRERQSSSRLSSPMLQRSRHSPRSRPHGTAITGGRD